MLSLCRQLCSPTSNATARFSMPMRYGKSVTLAITHRNRQFFKRVTPNLKSRFGDGGKSRHRAILTLGLLSGGGLAIYWAAKWMRRPGNDATRSDSSPGALFDNGAHLGPKLVASCRERETSEEMKTGSTAALRNFEPAIKKARDLLQRAKDEVGSPGIVAAVTVDGKLVWSEGIGFADVENRTPCTPDSMMRIASISKPLTMATVARLWEEGKLDLDDPVQEYVPNFPEKEWDGEEVDITTRHLASHLAGIRHYSKSYMNKKKGEKDNKEQSEVNEDKKPSDKVAKSGKGDSKDKGKAESTKENKSKIRVSSGSEAGLPEMKSKKEYHSVTESLAMFKDDPLMHKPGTKYIYTTHGWTLISAVVEGASGKDFLTYMTGMLADLGLKKTVPDKHIPLIYNRARGYQYSKSGILENCPYVDLSYKWAGGGYLSTVLDLTKFGNAMLYSYQYSPSHKDMLPGFLKPETVQELWTPISMARAKPTNESCYGLGWTVVEKEQVHGCCRPRRHFVAHSGAAMGFSSILTVAPSRGITETTSSRDVQEKKSSGGISETTSSKEIPEKAEKSVTETDSKLGLMNHGRVQSEGLLDDVVVTPPKGIVVALIANLIDVGLSKTSEEIIALFQDCQDT